MVITVGLRGLADEISWDNRLGMAAENDDSRANSKTFRVHCLLGLSGLIKISVGLEFRWLVRLHVLESSITWWKFLVRTPQALVLGRRWTQ